MAELQAKLAAAETTVAGNQQKIDELRSQLGAVDAAAGARITGLPVHQGDLRPGQVRLRGLAGRRRLERRAQGRGGRGARKAHDRAAHAGPEDGSRTRGAAAAARAAQRRSGNHSGADHGDAPGREPAAHAAGRHRAEPGQGLLPERAAPRFPGADAQDSADHPAERRRRRELHPGARRWIGARRAISRSIGWATRSFHSRSRRTRTWRRISAATRRIRWIRSAAPSATRAWVSRSASAMQRTCRRPRSRKRSGKRNSAGKSRICGTTRCCRRA